VTNAAIYTRLSQDRDGTKGGTDRQEKDCRALCKREGLKVVKVYTDDDRSAYSGKPRPAFEQMLTELDGVDAVVFWKTDRLVRRWTQFGRVVEACEAAKVRLVSVVDPIDTSTPILKGVAGLIASMGEQESKNISLRVARFHEDAAANGRPHGHRRAFGYTPAMEIIPEEAKAIREARDRILRGDSMRLICTDWNERGVSPTSAPAWRVTTFKRMITGPLIAGLRQFHGEIVAAGTWKAIISPDQRDQLLAAVGDPKVRKRGRPARYLLTGIIRCGKCDAVLRSSVKGDGTRRWSCRRIPGDESHCGRLDVRADHVDELVEAALLHRLDSPALARAQRRGKHDTKAKTDSRTLADLEARVVQLGLDHDAGLISRKEWLSRRAPLRDRVEAARSELSRASDAKPLEAFDGVDVRRRWSQLDLEGRRRVASVMIDHVTIDAPETRGNTFDSRRVKITWRT
jgi:DNA invertase Pin-like site-specific DNA recombinase